MYFGSMASHGIILRLMPGPLPEPQPPTTEPAAEPVPPSITQRIWLLWSLSDERHLAMNALSAAFSLFSIEVAALTLNIVTACGQRTDEDCVGLPQYLEL